MFSPKAREKLKYYVYLYIDPQTNQPFYVGKGMKNRCFSHLKDKAESAKTKIIEDLDKLGYTPRIEILKYGLTEDEALLVESTAIDLLGVESLTNKVKGHGSKHGARAEVTEIAATLDAKDVTIIEPVILININRNYRPNMSVHAIYDATRSAWKVGSKRDKPAYAMSIHGGIVREVFAISTWVEGGTTMQHSDRDGRPHIREGRWEFIGQVAEETVRKKYLGKSVAHYFKPGAQNPIMYVNCDQ